MISIYNEDCRQGLLKFPENSFDIAIYSPPYKDKDNYSPELIRETATQVYRTLKDNSLCFVNFGHLKEDKSRPFKVCLIHEEVGFKLNDTITAIKNHYTPLPGNNLNNLTEFIFMLYKGDKCPNLDRLALGVPYMDASNAARYNKGINLRCRGNVWPWKIPTINNSNKRLHPDEFPYQIPLWCLKLSGLKQGTVLDPFSGSGSTGLASKELGLDYVGFEKNEKYIEISKERLK